jgi:hypothetical protein
MHEEFFFACALLMEDANFTEFFEIDGCGLAFGDVALD